MEVLKLRTNHLPAALPPPMTKELDKFHKKSVERERKAWQEMEESEIVARRQAGKESELRSIVSRRRTFERRFEELHTFVEEDVKVQEEYDRYRNEQKSQTSTGNIFDYAKDLVSKQPKILEESKESLTPKDSQKTTTASSSNPETTSLSSSSPTASSKYFNDNISSNTTTESLQTLSQASKLILPNSAMEHSEQTQHSGRNPPDVSVDHRPPSTISCSSPSSGSNNTDSTSTSLENLSKSNVIETEVSQHKQSPTPKENQNVSNVTSTTIPTKNPTSKPESESTQPANTAKQSLSQKPRFSFLQNLDGSGDSSSTNTSDTEDDGANQSYHKQSNNTGTKIRDPPKLSTLPAGILLSNSHPEMLDKKKLSISEPPKSQNVNPTKSTSISTTGSPNKPATKSKPSLFGEGMKGLLSFGNTNSTVDDDDDSSELSSAGSDRKATDDRKLSSPSTAMIKTRASSSIVSPAVKPAANPRSSFRAMMALGKVNLGDDVDEDEDIANSRKSMSKIVHHSTGLGISNAQKQQLLGQKAKQSAAIQLAEDDFDF